MRERNSDEDPLVDSEPPENYLPLHGSSFPNTICGLPYGCCPLCEPEQIRLTDKERAGPVKRGWVLLGDYFDECPVEWEKPGARKFAIWAFKRWGAELALKKVRKWRHNHGGPGTWSRRYDDWVIEVLEGFLDADRED